MTAIDSGFTCGSGSGGGIVSPGTFTWQSPSESALVQFKYLQTRFFWYVFYQDGNERRLARPIFQVDNQVFVFPI